MARGIVKPRRVKGGAAGRVKCLLGLSAWLIAHPGLAQQLSGEPIDRRVASAIASVDENASRIHDALEKGIKDGQSRKARFRGRDMLDLIVSLDRPPSNSDRQIVSALGGRVVSEWRHALYAMHVWLPAEALDAFLAFNPDCVLIEENVEITTSLGYSTR